VLRFLFDFLIFPTLKKNFAAPLFEEWIFRTLMTIVLQQHKLSSGFIILYTSILFSFSHAHNFFRLFKRPRITFKMAILSTAFQMFFTFIFGLYCSYDILQTNSFYSAAILHAMCNIYGVPPVSQLFSDLFSKKQRIGIFVAYIAGLVGFFMIVLS